MDRLVLGRADALIAVDVQRDFCPGGALPVEDGDKVVPVLNDLARRAAAAGANVVATRDWHPPDHVSFRERGGPWPPHCVCGTPGAEFHEGLRLPDVAIVISKATQRDQDAYSGFQGTELSRALRQRGVRRVLVGGLATDYCVRATALDARSAGFETIVIEDASRGVEVHPGDVARALDDVRSAGCRVVRSQQIG